MPLLLTWVSDINIDTNGVRIRDPNMILGCNPGKDVTMVPYESIGHSGWYGLYNSEAF